MAESKPSGNARRRRALALTEIEALAVNLLANLRILEAGLECILAEVKEARA